MRTFSWTQPGPTWQRPRVPDGGLERTGRARAYNDSVNNKYGELTGEKRCSLIAGRNFNF